MSKILVKPLMGVFKSGKWESIPDTVIVKNGVEEITLRGWQSDILELWKNSSLPNLFINCPTGSGKSKAALAIITNDYKNSDKLVIISAPQKVIGKGFLKTTGTPQKILGHAWTMNPANNLCEGDYKNDDGNIAQLKRFIKNPRLADLNERILICCHATLSILFDTLTEDEKNTLIENIVLCVDESHHSLSQEETGNGLGKVVNYFLQNQSKQLELIMMTATPFRGDKGSLIPTKYLDTFERYDLDYGRHFEENCASLEFTYNAVLHQYGDSYGVVIEQLLNKYLDRDDKVLIQIPPSNRSISNGKFNDLQMIYDAIGPDQKVDDHGIVNISKDGKIIRIVDLVSEKDRESRLDYLSDNPNSVDIVVGISMIKEGFDWPPANAGILIGSQGSLNAQIQLMGRMFRAYENKGRDNGMKPVDICQIFPYIDHEKLDEDAVREQINTFMKVVYAALAMELVINPIHIDLPLKNDGDVVSKPRTSVKEFLLDNLTDTQYTELVESIVDDYRDWKANNQDEDNTGKLEEIVSERLTELGITENHKEIGEFFNKSFQRTTKFHIKALEGIDVSGIDIDLMEDITDPLDSILMGMSNGLCGASDIRGFQMLMKPVDTLRRCYELKEWVEKNGRFPIRGNTDYEDNLYKHIIYVRMSKHGVGTGKLTFDHIKVLESIHNWTWKSDRDRRYANSVKFIKWVKHNGRLPTYSSEDKTEKKWWLFASKIRQMYNGTYYKRGINIALPEDIIRLFENIPDWRWTIKDYSELIYSIKQYVEMYGVLPSQKNKNPDIAKLGRFIVNKRQVKKGHAVGALSENLIKELESIPKWKW
jgi:hypothetical protein